MALPVVGLFGAVVAYVGRKIAVKIIAVPLLILIFVFVIALIFAFIGSMFYGLTFLFNALSSLISQFDQFANSDHIVFKIVSASGAISAITDLFTLFLPIFILVLGYKASLVLISMFGRIATYIHQISSVIQE